jgi:PAS domain S-box-containing protein
MATASQPEVRRSRPSPETLDPGATSSDLPVAVLTPTGYDSAMVAKVLGRAGLKTIVCADVSAVCKLVDKEEIGVVLLAEEALLDGAREKLMDALSSQPSWSDVPIVLLTGEEELSRALPKVLQRVAASGNVTLLERPVRVATLTTVIESGLRARRRQLDVKAHLLERRTAEQTLRESEARLRAAVQAAPYPLMLHADDGQILQLSEAWLTLTGYYATPVTTTDEWTQLAFPDGENPLRPTADSCEAAGESVHVGERTVKVADGSTRIWDFHRVALGELPDGRRLSLTAAIDVTSYRKLVESERAARREAENANAAKSQFLATMSHELRTPLNAIAGYAQLLILGVRGPITEAQREDLDRIDRSQRHLLSLINDVLNFAKIEAGHVEIAHTSVGMDAVIEGLKEFVEPQLQAKGLRFSTSDRTAGAEVYGDPDKIRQILINLLSNAIKFTSEGGHISLDCEGDAERVYVRVRDDGVGIPDDKLEPIFEPFVQVSRVYASSHQGTGLGLSISRDLARRMGGDLTATSKLGEGSTFTLSLPRP